MSYIPPTPPRFMHATRPLERPRKRAADLNCVTDESSPLGWRWQTVYRPIERSWLKALSIRWRWQVRAWRWEYGWDAPWEGR